MHQPGTLIEGKYEILGKLREGGMGTLYRVRHRLLDEVRVVKVLRPQALGDDDMKRRFLEEARTATRLKHPNICTIHDFALDDEGKAYLVMEFIDGVTLADLVRRQGPRGLGLSLEVAHQTLGALGYLHRKNVVHRDVAPDNLMLTRDEEGRPLVKVIDLGIAKTLDRPGEMTSTGVFLGKLKYASPEQFGSLPAGEKLDGRSDLYALGVVLYEVLTGKYPFAGESPTELLRAHLFDPPMDFAKSDPEGSVPPEVRAVLLKALAKKREDRFASADEFDREIVNLQRLHTRPEDLDDTAQVLSRLRQMPAADPGVTPSAQDRLDRQFGPSSTPPPLSAPSLATGPDRDATRVVESGPRPADKDEEDTQPMHRPPSRPWLYPVLAAAAVLAAALLWSSGVFRRGEPAVPAPRPAPAASPAALAAPAPTRPDTAPAVPAAVNPEPTPVPATAVAEVPTPAPALPPPPAGQDAAEELRRLRAQVEQSRQRAAAARERAQRANAAEQAAALYEFGVSKEKEARDLAARGQAAASAAAFDASRDSFDRAELWSRTHPAAAHAPPPEKAAPAPEATVRHEPLSALPPPTAAPALARPPAAEAARPPERMTDEEKIREVIRRYERAQSALDADLYAAVFPSVDRARVRAAFAELKSQTLEFGIQKIEVAPGGASAVVRGHEERVAAPRVGTEQRLSTDRVVTLEKRGDSWVITRLAN